MTYELQTHQQPSFLHEYTYVPVRVLRSLDSALLRVPSTKTVTAACALMCGRPSTLEQSTRRRKKFYISIPIPFSAERTFV